MPGRDSRTRIRVALLQMVVSLCISLGRPLSVLRYSPTHSSHQIISRGPSSEDSFYQNEDQPVFGAAPHRVLFSVRCCRGRHEAPASLSQVSASQEVSSATAPQEVSAAPQEVSTTPQEVSAQASGPAVPSFSLGSSYLLHHPDLSAAQQQGPALSPGHLQPDDGGPSIGHASMHATSQTPRMPAYAYQMNENLMNSMLLCPQKLYITFPWPSLCIGVFPTSCCSHHATNPTRLLCAHSNPLTACNCSSPHPGVGPTGSGALHLLPDDRLGLLATQVGAGRYSQLIAITALVRRL